MTLLLPGQLEPSIRLGRQTTFRNRLQHNTTSSDNVMVRMRPLLWTGSGVSIKLNPHGFLEEQRVPTLKQRPKILRSSSGASVGSYQIEREKSSASYSLPDVKLQEIPINVRTPKTIEELKDREHYQNKLRKRHEATRGFVNRAAPSSDLNLAIQRRSVCRTIRNLKEVRRNRWLLQKHKKTTNALSLTLPSQRSQSLYSPRYRHDIQVNTEHLREKFQEHLNLVQKNRYSAKAPSLQSHRSARDLILTEGTASGVPPYLRELNANSDEHSIHKVNSWLDTHSRQGPI